MLAIVVAVLLTTLAALVLLKNAVGWDIYLDQLSLAQMPQILDGNTPPRMAMASALAFLLLGTSLLFARIRAAPWFTKASRSSECSWAGWACRDTVRRRGVVCVRAHGRAHRDAVAAADGALAHACGPMPASRACSRARSRRWHGAPPAASGHHRAIAGRRVDGALRAARRAELRGCGVRFCARECVVFVAFVWINAARGERADSLRRAAERALRLSEERNQLIVETALDGVVTIDNLGATSLAGTPRRSGCSAGRAPRRWAASSPSSSFPNGTARTTGAACGGTSRPAWRACSTSASR
jgi:PAS domain-containing protein